MPFLEYMRDPRQIARRVRVMPVPYVIGRAEDANFVVSSPVVSGRHAELFDRSGELWIRDLNSRNGTHVNGRPITECKLADGDIIHVANQEFRFVLGQVTATVANIAATPGTLVLNEKIPPVYFSVDRCSSKCCSRTPCGLCFSRLWKWIGGRSSLMKHWGGAAFRNSALGLPSCLPWPKFAV
ncbi:MAG: FHA domain-containing protein [Gemmataceae bacterium]|nr:FHA domain-containing protein [Gemmataceae bacterium]